MKTLLITVLPTLVLALAAEIVLRVAFPFPLSTRATYQRFADVFYFHAPNSRGTEVSPIGEFPMVRLRYNGFGFRGEWNEVPTGMPVHVVLGDSFIEARQVPEERTATGLLAKKFPGQFFVNAGCSGYTTTTEYLLLKNRLANFRPKHVSLFFTFNDYQDNAVYDGGYYLQPNVFTNGPTSPNLTSSPIDKMVWLEEHFAVTAYVKLLGQRMRPLTPAPTPEPPNRFDRNLRAVNKATEAMDEVERAVLDFTHQGLREIHRLVQSFSGELSVYIIPLPTQLNANEWKTGKTAYFGYSEGYVDTSDVYQQRLLAFCTREMIHCVDLRAAFRQSAGPNYLDYDGHWTEQGNEVVAKAVASGLK